MDIEAKGEQMIQLTDETRTIDKKSKHHEVIM